MENTERQRVLFILGLPRSGSTILGNILNECRNGIFVGELETLGTHCRTGGRPCGCDLPIPECPLWAPVLAALDGRLGQSAPRRALDALRQPPSSLTSDQLEEVDRLVGVLYHLAARESGCEIVIDSSKTLHAAQRLARSEAIDLRIVHLVRDCRGVCFSRQRNRDLRLREKRHPRPWLARQRKLLLLLDGWSWVRETRRARRWLDQLPSDTWRRISYSDLSARPAEVVGALTRWAGLDGTVIDGEGVVHLGGNHSVGGNRNRSITGAVPIREDRSWRQGLTRLESWMLERLQRLA